MQIYRNSLEQTLAMLERIDLLIRHHVWLIQQGQTADFNLQGLYISDQEVNESLARAIGLPMWATTPASREIKATVAELTTVVTQRTAVSLAQNIELRLHNLAQRFNLGSFEVDCLLICFASEIDLRYERLYAYLQDDLTKKRPSIDLVLNLLCQSLDEKIAALGYFAVHAPLRQYDLVVAVDEPNQQAPSQLSKYLRLDQRITHYLLGQDQLDSVIAPYTTLVTCDDAQWQRLPLPLEFVQRLEYVDQAVTSGSTGSILYLQGSDEVGQQALAAAFCYAQNSKLLVVACRQLVQLEDEKALHTAVIHIMREAQLSAAAIYWSHFDVFLVEEKAQYCKTILDSLFRWQGITILGGQEVWEPTDLPLNQPFIRIPIPQPTARQRQQLWATYLNGNSPWKDAKLPQAQELSALADRFRLTQGQIRDAAKTAFNLARWDNPRQPEVQVAHLYRASRLQSNRKLTALAQAVTPRYTWDDIVLPAEQLSQLQAICRFVKHHALVYETWGFQKKLALGKGLNVLFAGVPGTGKTMAADVVAGELGLDLYKIDLSMVVSKYIGETEKNLARIFAEGETANAILFFDEADALFGKRSEVKDAHDRYANIETSFLLQKMEEYDGIVILATNLRKNMDEAFVRRLAFTITFPFPKADDRLRIWQGIWPAETPLSPELDLDFMAQQFKLAGGNIKNIALAATFLAADNGQTVGMEHLTWATKQEFLKMGKAFVKSDFGPYYDLVAEQ